MSEPRVVPIDGLDLVLEPKPWVFAQKRHREIDAHFEKLKRDKPALWNGRVLLMHRCALEAGVMRGGFLEADYASFATWQDWGRPDADIYDCFAAAAIASADGAYLVGVMGAHTYNAGDIYFPCGTPDLDDIADGKVDFGASVLRELKEETGLDSADVALDPGWTVVIDNDLIAAIKVMHSPFAAEPLRARILENLAREKQPELTDILVVRSTADFSPKFRRFVCAFLAHRFDHR